jgi:hypothetical protein
MAITEKITWQSGLINQAIRTNNTEISNN